ncbi:Cytochrome c oxidase assembly protein COX11, mitochondrial [Aphelenchoides besseyi]|nr:Cytochrome c oxidase assembly protein COX11, mitochondrial [Aphelenchoides besseyi]
MNSLRLCCLRNLILRNGNCRSILRELNSSVELRIRPLTSTIQSSRFASGWQGSEKQYEAKRKANRDTMFYVVSIGVIAIGLTFAAIPAYRMFCEATSFGGLTQVAKDFDKIEKMEKVKGRLIRVQFNADVPSSMRWNFKPLQHEIYVHPGETALAFFSAKNPTDKPIVGISSYNLTPFNAAYYFNKIQCFCFEEQILNPGEEVELPVFFYIDPDYANDPSLENLDSILLSYTFFEAKSGLQIPSPFDPKNRPNLAVPFQQMSAKA